jgi:hypothetical protein
MTGLKGWFVFVNAFALLSDADAVEPNLNPVRAPANIELRDQHDSPQRLTFPATNLVVLAIADKTGAEQVDAWIAAIKPRYAGQVEIRGIADVRGVPSFLRGKVRKKFQQTRQYPVMMDWSGEVCAKFNFQPGVANLFLIARDGSIVGRWTGTATHAAVSKLSASLDRALNSMASSNFRPAASTR